MNKNLFVILYIFYFVGRKGEKGETSKAEISNVEESISDLQENINETLSNSNKKNTMHEKHLYLIEHNLEENAIFNAHFNLCHVIVLVLQEKSKTYHSRIF